MIGDESMKKYKIIIFFILVFFGLIYTISNTTEVLSAQSDDDLKIAVVDYNKVFNEYSVTRTQFIQLSNEKEKLMNYIKEKQQEIQNDKDIYKEQEDLYDEGEKRERLLEIWMKMLKLELEIKEKTQNLEESEKTIIEQINARIDNAIEKARQDLGFDIVINKSSVFSVGDDITDITDYVINLLTE
jgi:Skp family chaperone for outer membrane proteins